jgi:hypothetical protein
VIGALEGVYGDPAAAGAAGCCALACIMAEPANTARAQNKMKVDTRSIRQPLRKPRIPTRGTISGKCGKRKPALLQTYISTPLAGRG